MRTIATRSLAAVSTLLTVVLLALAARMESATTARRSQDGERGDVPGWVMITVMTAIVVIALLAAFKQQVLDAVNNAFGRVTGAN